MLRLTQKLSLACALAVSISALLSAPPAAAQVVCDPNTLPPYVFILLDTSGSLNWAPPCTQAELDSGLCSFLCSGPDCSVPLQGDSPSSKLFQIKAGLHEALNAPEAANISFGFASFNQDALRALAKHWLYTATGSGVAIPGWGLFPAAGWQEVMGKGISCTGSGDDGVGCTPSNPADLTDAWELERVRQLPKWGIPYSQTVYFYVRHAGLTYRMQYAPVAGGTLGGPLSFQVRSERCLNSTCTTRGTLVQSTVSYTLASEFLSWQNGTSRSQPFGYFSFSAGDTEALNSCSGWDSNTDSAADKFNNQYSLRWTTVADPRGTPLDRGDVIPLDWQNDHRADIQTRMAPNLAGNPLAVPDFRISPYLRDALFGGETFLRLKNELNRPLIAVGSTPLGATLQSFRNWYPGWRTLAMAQDPLFPCRLVNVILLTDGDETCAANACTVAADLVNNFGVRTYAVGYGADPASSPTLLCTATNGGTIDPLFPRNQSELTQALEQIFLAAGSGLL